MSEEIIKNCMHCQNLDDVSNGPEYGGPHFICTKKQNMSNLKQFPFNTPQKCFDEHWSLSVDWDKIGRESELKRITSND